MYDRDAADLGIGDAARKPSGRQTADADSRTAASIMDDLLGKKSAADKPPSGGGQKREFVLDDRYKKKTEPGKILS